MVKVTSTVTKLIVLCSLYASYVSKRRNADNYNKKAKKKTNACIKSVVGKMSYQIFFISILFTLVVKQCLATESRMNSLKFTDYCPKIGVCRDDSHVLCRNFNSQNHVVNECEEIDNRTMTSEMAGYILQVTNAMRSRLALGIEKGKDGVTLPRGYGLRRLIWDPELATFAQIWADTCRNDKDSCHATTRFADPGQFLVNFRLGASHSYPEMEIPDDNKANGYTDKKLLKYITSMLKYIFSRKNIVTPEIVHRVNLEDSSKTAYHQFMNGDVTHIGCGLSIFSRYYNHDTKNLIKNIKFVCNLSAKLQHRKPLFRTNPPVSGETQRCGCPAGFAEDEGCLCYERDANGPCGENHEKCKPSQIILPIVQNSINDIYSSPQTFINRYTPLSKIKLDVRTRHFDKLSKKQSNKQKVSSKRKQSLFLEVPKFVLPQQYKPDIAEKSDFSNKDVIVPRKDFSEARGLVNNYLNTKHLMTNDYNEDTRDLKNIEADFDGYVDKNFRIKGANESNDPGKSNYDKEYDANVMNLLDRLEQEIHNGHFKGQVKQVVDAKIRQLYDNIIGRNEDDHSGHSDSRIEHQSFNEEHQHQHNHEHEHNHIHERNVNVGKFINKLWDKDIGYENKAQQFRESQDYSGRNVYGNYNNNYVNDKRPYYQNRIEDDNESNYQKNRFYRDHAGIKNRKVEISIQPIQQEYNMNRPVQRFVRPLALDNEGRLSIHQFPINKRGMLTISKLY